MVKILEESVNIIDKKLSGRPNNQQNPVGNCQGHISGININALNQIYARKNMIEINWQQQRLTDPNSLNRLFGKCKERENTVKPDWEDHKRIILNDYQAGNKP